MQAVQSAWSYVVAGLFDAGVAAFIVRRMRSKMTSDAFYAAAAIEGVTVVFGILGMLIKGYGVMLMLVLFGLGETAIVLSTWGRIEIFFNVIAEPDSWWSRHATIVGLRFCAAILALFVAALPLLFQMNLFRS